MSKFQQGVKINAECVNCATILCGASIKCGHEYSPLTIQEKMILTKKFGNKYSNLTTHTDSQVLQKWSSPVSRSAVHTGTLELHSWSARC